MNWLKRLLFWRNKTESIDINGKFGLLEGLVTESAQKNNKFSRHIGLMMDENTQILKDINTKISVIANELSKQNIYVLQLSKKETIELLDNLYKLKALINNDVACVLVADLILRTELAAKLTPTAQLGQKVDLNLAEISAVTIKEGSINGEICEIISQGYMTSSGQKLRNSVVVVHHQLA